MHEVLAAIGIETSRSPLNLSFVFALLCCLLVWLFIWQTRFGYALRVVGKNEAAAVYGGISPARQIMLAMAISGALAGFVALNIVHGRAAPPDPRLHRRLRLRRHRRRADGAQAIPSASSWPRCCSARSIRAARSCRSTCRHSAAIWSW